MRSVWEGGGRRTDSTKSDPFRTSSWNNDLPSHILLFAAGELHHLWLRELNSANELKLEMRFPMLVRQFMLGRRLLSAAAGKFMLGRRLSAAAGKGSTAGKCGYRSSVAFSLKKEWDREIADDWRRFLLLNIINGIRVGRPMIVRLRLIVPNWMKMKTGATSIGYSNSMLIVGRFIKNEIVRWSLSGKDVELIRG